MIEWLLNDGFRAVWPYLERAYLAFADFRDGHPDAWAALGGAVLLSLPVLAGLAESLL